MRKPSPGLPEHVLLRHLHALEHELAGRRAAQAELGLDAAGGTALHRLRLDDEGGHAFVARRAVGVGVQEPGVADMRLRDPHLVAVDLVMVALVDRVRLHAGDVGAGVGLGHGEETELRAGDPAGDVFCLLLGGAELGDGQGGAEVLHVERQPPRGRHLGDLLGHQHRFHEPHAAAAELLRQRAGEEAEGAHLGDAIGLELVFAFLVFQRRRISSAAKRRAVSWIIRCSSLRSNCIVAPSFSLHAPGGAWAPSCLKIDPFPGPLPGGVMLYSMTMRTSSPTTLSPLFTRTSFTDAGGRRVDQVFHLHRLDDEQFVVDLDLRTRLDHDVENVSAERGPNFYRHGVSLCRFC